jgi:putative oxidoreductase
VPALIEIRRATMNQTALLAGRTTLSLMFIAAGAGKIAGYAATQQYMESVGVPGALLPLVILAEVGGGLALLTGTLTRFAALGLALFSLVAGALFHMDFADQNQMTHFMKNLTIAGGLLVLATAGPGRFSIDALIGKRRSPAAVGAA